MSFIDEDRRITYWQKKKQNKLNLIETSVTSSFLSSFFPSRLELFCSMADVSCVNSQVGHISVAYFFFSCHQYLHCLYLCFTELQWAGFRTRFQCEVWANMFAAFLHPSPGHLSSFWCFENLQNHPVSLKIYVSLLIANSKSVLNIKSRKTSHVIIFKKTPIQSYFRWNPC